MNRYIIIKDLDQNIIEYLDPISILSLSQVSHHYFDVVSDARSHVLETKLDARDICARGYIWLIRYLIEELHEDIDISRAFDMSCLYGHIDLCNYLLSCANKINQRHIITDKIGELFRRACASGQLDILKYLITLDSNNFDLHAYHEKAFFNACVQRHFDIAEYLVELSKTYGKINIHVLNDHIFRAVCTDSLEGVDYLLDLGERLCDPYDIHHNDEIFFISACEYGQLSIIQRLIELGEKSNHKINIHTRSDEAFRTACICHQFAVVEYLIKLSFGSYGLIPDELINRYI